MWGGILLAYVGVSPKLTDQLYRPATCDLLLSYPITEILIFHCQISGDGRIAAPCRLFNRNTSGCEPSSLLRKGAKQNGEKIKKAVPKAHGLLVSSPSRARLVRRDSMANHCYSERFFGFHKPYQVLGWFGNFDALLFRASLTNFS
jgi:hypothetical protein